MKINTITAVFLFVCIPLSGILWIDPTGLFTITPREFSRANFSAVEVGMTKRAIRELLGEPFNRLEMKWNERASEVWTYGRKNNVNVLFRDYSVFFDKNDRVLEAKSNIDY